MNFAGLSRPARGAGLGLLAIAVIAAVIGGITLATGGGGGKVAGPSQGPAPGGPPPGASTTSPGATTGPGASSNKQPPTSEPPGTGESSAPGGDAPTSSPGKPGTGRPGGTAGPGDTGGANGETNGRSSNTDIAVRVYNNSNIDNLASRAAGDLRDQGWTVAEVDNYPYGVVPATTAYYRKGTEEKAAALSLAAAFGMRAQPRFDGISDASPGVIIIVTKDYTGPVGKSG